jgi:SAM-dependent methyltransferase
MFKLPFFRKKEILKSEESLMLSGNLPVSDHEIRPRWRHIIPIPNESLIATVNDPGLLNFYHLGEVGAHLVSAFLPKRARILDVGCGCAKLARFLHIIPTIKSYVGFDVIPESIKWSIQAFAHVNDTRFTFVHANIYSDVYNPSGTIKATEYKFPVPDGAVNFVIATSLFTHLFEDECRHYLDEVVRSLCRGGQALISIHDEPTTGIRYSGTRSRIDIERDYFIEIARKSGLTLIDEVKFVQCYFIFKRQAWSSHSYPW